ncbi:histidine phosphotransferase [Ancylobacter dichloromethanicus]|uniref:Histidine phosphotransferase n=1 Tax=Ancylobacter dichloromethanicus TaxID=518825 RepID=A0A9W6N045_9HYPH|nr:histidine phosphotransferase family protein [Ancylobacter dichloromethanicus]MBS7553622.1 histidine phosphotransferase [Ancylobacter dichloromethanicus]GLK72685.1 histidine phosphotransferase [Ancylobacter dichloromethanicus]
MTTAIDLDKLDLAALLCSRVCHDVISPVGAIVNGLEVLEDEDDPAMKSFALDLIAKSARQASARLQFARLAFGAAGSAGAQIDTGDAEKVARGFIEDDRTSLAWQLPRVLAPKNKVKLLLNLLVVATSTIPRGGRLAVEENGAGEEGGFRLSTQGSHSRIPPHLVALLAGQAQEGGALDAHAIQPHYTGLLARATGYAISLAHEGDQVTILVARG